MAKTVNNIFDDMIRPERIEDAIYRAAKGKRRKRAVRYALAHSEEVAAKIHKALKDGTWRPPAVRRGFEINDGIRAKKRIIVHPSFEEQIVDHVVIDYLEPIFMRRFYRWSCGSIPGRGQEEMTAHIMREIRRNPKKAKYHAVLDVAKCFDTLNVDAIYNQIKRRYISDKRVLSLIRLMLDANTVKLTDGSIRKGGVPIGLFTSPWFANIALDVIDHVFKDDCGLFLVTRFMDDMLVVHPNRRILVRAIDAAGTSLAAFGLAWKRLSAPIRWVDGNQGKVRFCGAQMTRSTCVVRDRVYIRARRTSRNIRRKIDRRIRVTAYDAQRLVSYGGRFRAFESWNAFRAVLGGVRYADMRRKISIHDKLLNERRKYYV